MGVSARNRAPWVWAREATATAHPDYFSNMAAEQVEYVMSVANEEPEVDPETADALTGVCPPPCQGPPPLMAHTAEAIAEIMERLPVFVPPEHPALTELQTATADGSSPPPNVRLYVLSLAHSLLEYDAAVVLICRIQGVFRQAGLMCRFRRWAAMPAANPFKTPDCIAECDAILQAMRQEDPATARAAPLFPQQAEYYQAKLEDFIATALAAADALVMIWPSARTWCQAATVKQAALDMDTCGQCRGPLVPGHSCRLCATHFF